MAALHRHEGSWTGRNRMVAVGLLLAIAVLGGCAYWANPLDAPEARSVEVEQLIQYLTNTYVLRNTVRPGPYTVDENGPSIVELRPEWSGVIPLQDAHSLDWAPAGPGAGEYSRMAAPVSIAVVYDEGSYSLSFTYSGMATRPLVNRLDWYTEYEILFGSYTATGSLTLERTSISEVEVVGSSGATQIGYAHDGSLAGVVNLTGGRIRKITADIAYSASPNQNPTTTNTFLDLVFDVTGTIVAEYTDGTVHTISH